MKEIEKALQPITGYLISITRNTVSGWYELEIGLPNSWVYDENDKISCEVTKKFDEGSLIKIAPKNEKIVIDDLVAFVGLIIKTNRKIAEKEKEFNSKMDEMKNRLEEEAKRFYTELDELKETSFKKATDDFSSNLETKPKRGRPKGSTTKKKTPVVTEETEVVEETKD